MCDEFGKIYRTNVFWRQQCNKRVSVQPQHFNMTHVSWRKHSIATRSVCVKQIELVKKIFGVSWQSRAEVIHGM